jgi:MFS family permease
VKQSGSYLGDLRTVLGGSDFRRLLTTRLISQAGDGAFQVGLASIFFFSPERAATTEAAALAFAVTLLPYTLVGPFAGVLLDRWRRRQVLLRSNLVRAAMVLAVAGLVTQGLVGLPLYLVVLACLSVNRFFLAGLGASLPHVVPADRLVMANAVTPTAGTLAVLFGAGAAYGVRSLLGARDQTDALVLVLAAVAYLGSAFAAGRMAPDLLGPDPDDRAHAPATAEHLAQIGRELALSARHVRERRPAFHGLAAIGAHRVAYGLSTIATILLCRNYFNGADEVDAGLGLLAEVVAASGAGFAVAAVVTPAAVRSLGKTGWITTCFLGAAATEYLFTAWVTVPALVLGAFVLGVAAQGSKICVDAIVQEYVDDAFRGRVFAFYDVVFNAAFVAAALLAVLVVPEDGLSRWLYAAIASMYVVTAIGYAVAARRTTRARWITGSAAANRTFSEQRITR